MCANISVNSTWNRPTEITGQTTWCCDVYLLIFIYNICRDASVNHFGEDGWSRGAVPPAGLLRQAHLLTLGAQWSLRVSPTEQRHVKGIVHPNMKVHWLSTQHYADWGKHSWSLRCKQLCSQIPQNPLKSNLNDVAYGHLDDITHAAWSHYYCFVVLLHFKKWSPLTSTGLDLAAAAVYPWNSSSVLWTHLLHLHSGE